MKCLTNWVVAGVLVALPRVAHAEFPTLDTAIRLAKEHALVVSDARGQLGTARAQLKGARASAIGNPYTDVQVDRPFSSYGTAGREVQALTFTYIPVDIAGQRGKRVAEASLLIGWKQIGLVEAAAAATGEVVTAYGELLVSGQRVVAANAGEQVARSEALYFQGRFEAKDTTIYEKSLAEAEVARWVQSKAEAELRVQAARAQFEQVTGLRDAELPPASQSILPPPLKVPLDEARLDGVVERAPVVAKLAAEQRYWDASIARYERERIPPVSFEILAGRGSTGEARFGAGAVLTYPITRRYQGEIAHAEAGKQTASQQLDLYRGMVHARLRAARDAVATVQKALDELDKNGLPALQLAVSSSVEAFRAGKIDITRAMLARRDLALALARRLDLLEASWRAYADLVIFSGELP